MEQTFSDSPGGPGVPPGPPGDEYQWHTGLKRPSGAKDAVEFVDVHKAFGRNKVLRGVNMGIPRGHDLDDPWALRDRQVGLHQAHWSGCCTPTRVMSSCTESPCPNMPDDELFAMRYGVAVCPHIVYGR